MNKKAIINIIESIIVLTITLIIIVTMWLDNKIATKILLTYLFVNVIILKNNVFNIMNFLKVKHKKDEEKDEK